MEKQKNIKRTRKISRKNVVKKVFFWKKFFIWVLFVSFWVFEWTKLFWCSNYGIFLSFRNRRKWRRTWKLITFNVRCSNPIFKLPKFKTILVWNSNVIKTHQIMDNFAPWILIQNKNYLLISTCLRTAKKRNNKSTRNHIIQICQDNFSHKIKSPHIYENPPEWKTKRKKALNHANKSNWTPLSRCSRESSHTQKMIFTFLNHIHIQRNNKNGKRRKNT